MPTTAFDTLTAAGQLEDAGIETRQAKAIVTVIRQSGEAVATKSDLTELKGEMTAAMSELKAEIFRALWIQGIGLVGAVTALMGAAVAVIKLF